MSFLTPVKSLRMSLQMHYIQGNAVTRGGWYDSYVLPKLLLSPCNLNVFVVKHSILCTVVLFHPALYESMVENPTAYTNDWVQLRLDGSLVSRNILSTEKCSGGGLCYSWINFFLLFRLQCSKGHILYSRCLVGWLLLLARPLLKILQPALVCVCLIEKLMIPTTQTITLRYIRRLHIPLSKVTILDCPGVGSLDWLLSPEIWLPSEVCRLIGNRLSAWVFSVCVLLSLSDQPTDRAITAWLLSPLWRASPSCADDGLCSLPATRHLPYTCQTLFSLFRPPLLFGHPPFIGILSVPAVMVALNQQSRSSVFVSRI